MKVPVNVRIDERLIHGQVAALWTKALKLDRIAVVDSEVVKNDMQKMLLKSATPTGVKLSIISPKRAADNFNNGKYDNEIVMVIVKGPETLKAIREEGYIFEEVNVGNITSKSGAKAVTKQIYISEEQENLFKELSDKTNFHVQLVPDAPKKDFAQVLEESN